MKTLKVFAAVLTLGFSLGASAATHEIKMLNTGKEGMMVFEPAFLKANKGDTIKFVPTDPSHDVASVAVPKGATPFAGAVDKAVTTVVKEEGVYVYQCKSHISMAMVGVIQVGKPANLEEAKKAATALAPQIVMNKERMDKYLGMVK